MSGCQGTADPNSGPPRVGYVDRVKYLHYTRLHDGFGTSRFPSTVAKAQVPWISFYITPLPLFVLRSTSFFERTLAGLSRPILYTMPTPPVTHPATARGARISMYKSRPLLHWC